MHLTQSTCCCLQIVVFITLNANSTRLHSNGTHCGVYDSYNEQWACVSVVLDHPSIARKLDNKWNYFRRTRACVDVWVCVLSNSLVVSKWNSTCIECFNFQHFFLFVFVFIAENALSIPIHISTTTTYHSIFYFLAYRSRGIRRSKDCRHFPFSD